MNLSGRYKLQTHENFEKFMKAIGLSDEMIQKRKDLKSIVEIIQDDKNFKVIVTTGSAVTIDKFTIGEEAELIIPTGEKMKAFVQLEGNNKLVIKLKDITSVIELNGDTLTTITSMGDLQYKRTSKRI